VRFHVYYRGKDLADSEDLKDLSVSDIMQKYARLVS
jgi:hypothetical protein